MAAVGHSNCHFHVEVTLDITDFDLLNNLVKTFLEGRKLLVQNLHSEHRRCSLTFFHVYICVYIDTNNILFHPHRLIMGGMLSAL